MPLEAAGALLGREQLVDFIHRVAQGFRAGGGQRQRLQQPKSRDSNCLRDALRCPSETPTLRLLSTSRNKQGYEAEIIPLTKEVAGSGGFAGNLLAGGLVGMGVDAVRRAQDHKPNPVIVTRKPVASEPRRPAKPRMAKPPGPES